MRADQQLWVVMLVSIALGTCVFVGFLVALHHRTKLEVLLTADNRRARIMADYYIHAGGAER